MFMQRKSTLEIEDNYRKHLIGQGSRPNRETYYRAWRDNRTTEDIEQEVKDFYNSFDSDPS